MARGFIEQIGAGAGVGSNSIDAETGHEAEVFGDLPERWKLVPVRVRGESAIGHALDEEPVISGRRRRLGSIGRSGDSDRRRAVGWQ